VFLFGDTSKHHPNEGKEEKKGGKIKSGGVPFSEELGTRGSDQ
jgi:hypothetical protein